MYYANRCGNRSWGRKSLRQPGNKSRLCHVAKMRDVTTAMLFSATETIPGTDAYSCYFLVFSFSLSLSLLAGRVHGTRRKYRTKFGESTARISTAPGWTMRNRAVSMEFLAVGHCVIAVVSCYGVVRQIT